MPQDEVFFIMLGVAALLMLISQWAYCKARFSDPGRNDEHILGEVFANSEEIKLRSKVLQQDEILLKKLMKNSHLD